MFNKYTIAVVIAAIVGLAQCENEIGFAQQNFVKQYVNNLKTVFKSMIHNEEFKSYQPFVTKCYNDNEPKFHELFTVTRQDMKKCGGERIYEVLPIVDEIINEIKTFLPKMMSALKTLWVCDTETCVDTKADKVGDGLTVYSRVVGQKTTKIMQLYKTEDADVRSCAMNVNKVALVDYMIIANDIKICLLRKIMRM